MSSQQIAVSVCVTVTFSSPSEVDRQYVSDRIHFYKVSGSGFGGEFDILDVLPEHWDLEYDQEGKQVSIDITFRCELPRDAMLENNIPYTLRELKSIIEEEELVSLDVLGGYKVFVNPGLSCLF